MTIFAHPWSLGYDWPYFNVVLLLSASWQMGVRNFLIVIPRCCDLHRRALR